MHVYRMHICNVGNKRIIVIIFLPRRSGPALSARCKPWCPCGVRVVSVWCPCGVRVLSVWCPCGVRVVSVCCPCGVRVVSVWCPCGVRVVSVWWSSLAIAILENLE